MELELDDAYDDLEPILQNIECKDDNVRFIQTTTDLLRPDMPPPDLHTLPFHAACHSLLVRICLSGGKRPMRLDILGRVCLQGAVLIAGREEPNGRGIPSERHGACAARVPGLGERGAVRAEPHIHAGRERPRPRLPQVLPALPRQCRHPGAPCPGTPAFQPQRPSSHVQCAPSPVLSCDL
jgi:hypothetical protein